MLSPNLFDTIGIQVSVAAATALASAGIAWFQHGMDNRGRSSRYRRLMTQIQDEIQVIEAWLRAYSLAAPAQARINAFLAAQYDLDLAYARFANASELERRPRAKPTAEIRRHWVVAYLSLLLFWPLGVYALVSAYQVRRLEAAGNMAAARRHARRVLIAFWASLAIFVLLELVILLANRG
jgi:hypothetical protein